MFYRKKNKKYGKIKSIIGEYREVCKVKKKAFTLVELLAVIVVLGIILAIAVPVVQKLIESSTDKLYDVTVNQIISGARRYLMEYKHEIPSLEEKGMGYLSLNRLIDKGILNEPIINPKIKKEFPGTAALLITVLLNGKYDIEFLITGMPTTLASHFSVNSVGDQGSYQFRKDSYYLAGTNPNNWLEWGQVSESDSTPLMWRIVKHNNDGIFIVYEGVKNGDDLPIGDGRVQIDDSWTVALDTSNSNKWERPATLKSKLNTWYNNLYVENKTDYVTTVNWCIGGINSPYTIDQFEAQECIDQESFQGLTSSTSAVGLLKASDYLSSSTSTTCDAYNQVACGNGNYLYKSSYWYWTHNADYSSASSLFRVYTDGSLNQIDASNDEGSVRPVISLKSSVLYKDGKGTLVEPYRIKKGELIGEEEKPIVPPPVITLLGDNPVNITVGDPYVDAGATAFSQLDGDITANISVVSTVNPNIPGIYTVTYYVSDSAGNPAIPVTRIVNVADINAPVITILGANPVMVNLGDPYVDAGATAWDVLDGDITANIQVTSNVNTNVQGIYTVTYNVKNSQGISAIPKVRTVNVITSTPPEIVLNGINPVTILKGNTYGDAGATAWDELDGDLTSSIQVTGTVNPNIAGIYTITYNVTNSQGNSANPVTRIVHVKTPTTLTWSYTGAVQIYNVPITGRYKFEVWGARGGQGRRYGDSYDNYSTGGLGGYAWGEIYLDNTYTNLNIYVGGQGEMSYSSGTVKPGGWNGGGTSSGYYTDTIDLYLGSGGGASDIRINGTELADRVIVAGGGGGGGAYHSSVNYYGGAGG